MRRGGRADLGRLLAHQIMMTPRTDTFEKSSSKATEGMSEPIYLHRVVHQHLILKLRLPPIMHLPLVTLCPYPFGIAAGAIEHDVD